MKPLTVTFANEDEARALQRAYDFFYCTKVATDALDAQYGKGTAKAAEHACSTLAAAFAERDGATSVAAADPRTLLTCADELDAAAEHDHGLIAISKLPTAWRERARAAPR